MVGFLSEELIEQARKGAEILKNGGVIGYPTDTVYGLGACAGNDTAVQRVFTIKNRPAGMPLPLLLGAISWLPDYALDISPVAMKLAEIFFPGAVTLVLRKSSNVSDVVSAGSSTIALRVPGHPVTLALINTLGRAITGTSANNNGMPSALTAGEVISQIGDKLDYIVDGGRCPGGVESTIIDVTLDVPVILRQGAVPRSDIEKICELKPL